MQIKGNTDGVNPSWPRSSLRLQREGMRKELGLEHAKQGGCSQSPGSGVTPPPGPHPQPPAGAVRLGPTPGNASCHPVATAPPQPRRRSPAPRGCGSRVHRSSSTTCSSSTQNPCTPPSSSFPATPDPLGQPPSHPESAPHVTGPGRVTWPSRALGRETGSGCRRVGRELASHDAVLSRLPKRRPGAAMLGRDFLSLSLNFRLPLILFPLATGSCAPPPHVLGRWRRDRQGSDRTVSGSEAWDAAEEFADWRNVSLRLLVGRQLETGPSCALHLKVPVAPPL